MQTLFLIIIAIEIIALCILIPAAIHVCRKDRSGGEKELRHRAETEQTFLRNEFFNSASKIMRETAKQKFKQW